MIDLDDDAKLGPACKEHDLRNCFECPAANDPPDPDDIPFGPEDDVAF